MIDYSVLAFLYALFLVVSGVVLLWISLRQGRKWIFGMFFSLGLAHIFLGSWFLLASVGLGIDYVPLAGCVWLPNSTTVSGDVSTYTWVDSCAGDAAPDSFTTLFTVWTWLLYIEIFLVVVVGFVAGMVQWLKAV